LGVVLATLGYLGGGLPEAARLDDARERLEPGFPAHGLGHGRVGRVGQVIRLEGERSQAGLLGDGRDRRGQGGGLVAPVDYP